MSPQLVLSPEITRQPRLSDLEEFDAAKFLTDEETIEAYLRFAQEADDPNLLKDAENDVMRARTANAKRNAAE